MLLSWLRKRRYKRILDAPFPDAWLRYLTANMGHFAYLDASERAHLQRLIQLFVATKYWEGCGGLRLTDEVRVTIAGQACLLVLGLENVLYRGAPYRNVDTILVYPSTVVPKRVESPVFASPTIVPPVSPLLGEAHSHGPIVLTWDAVRRGGIHPTSGHNVVYHEFAHKLDMLDGAIDGTPPLPTKRDYQRWVRVCTEVYERLRSDIERGVPTFLDPYGGTTTGEFFAVATELFFEKPLEMLARHPELFEVLRDFYRQDTAERARRMRP